MIKSEDVTPTTVVATPRGIPNCFRTQNFKYVCPENGTAVQKGLTSTSCVWYVVHSSVTYGGGGRYFIGYP